MFLVFVSLFVRQHGQQSQARVFSSSIYFRDYRDTEERIQIGMFRPIRVDHTNCLQVDTKTHSFIISRYSSVFQIPIPYRILVQYAMIQHDRNLAQFVPRISFGRFSTLHDYGIYSHVTTN